MVCQRLYVNIIGPSFLKKQKENKTNQPFRHFCLVKKYCFNLKLDETYTLLIKCPLIF